MIFSSSPRSSHTPRQVGQMSKAMSLRFTSAMDALQFGHMSRGIRVASSGVFSHIGRRAGAASGSAPRLHGAANCPKLAAGSNRADQENVHILGAEARQALGHHDDERQGA